MIPAENTANTCKKDAMKMVSELNTQSDGSQLVKDDKLVDLITNLTSMLLNVKVVIFILSESN